MYREARGESAPPHSRSKFIIGTGDRKHEEELQTASGETEDSNTQCFLYAVG